jgi:hypothetical protein
MPASGELTIPYIDIDQITYTSAWPGAAATGKSSERVLMYKFADDRTIWQSSAGTAGNPARFSPTSIVGWQIAWFTAAERANATLGGVNGDPDGDGLSNYGEFAYGLSPYLPDTKAATYSIGYDGANGPYLMVSFRRSLSIVGGTNGVTYNVDLSGGLPAWGSGAVQVGLPVNNGDGTETVTYRDNTLFLSAPQRLMRVRPTTP